MPEQLSNASSIRGAAMGRRSSGDGLNDPHFEPDHPVKFHLRHMPFVDQCYDKGGAYWGMGNPMFHAWGDGAEYEQEMFVRAINRADARKQILERFPNAKFYR